MRKTLPQLLRNIRACTHCTDALPCGARPVLQAHTSARLCIVGQAPGRKVHETGIPWNDPSGDRLRYWLGLTPEQFYDPRKVAIIPMGFCYPGKAASGDNPPRPECAPRWHEKLNAYLPDITLTLLLGQYAQAYYLGDRRKSTLGDTVKAWKEYLPLNYLPLAHPSPRNQPWLVRNPWFEEELVRELQNVIQALKL
jgi:uracil-DNA glycosylase